MLSFSAERGHHVLAEGDVLEEAPDHVEHLVRAERTADALELLQQHVEHPALVGAPGDEIDDANVPLLPVTVNAPHPLLEARRVPRDVVVHHQPAELEVDPFSGRVRGDEEACPVRLPKALHLLLALRPGHPAMDDRHLVRVAETFDAPHQEIHGVAVLGEDQPLVLGMERVFEHLAKLLELGLVAGVDKGAGAGAELLKCSDLAAQVLDADGGDRSEHRVLEILVALAGLGTALPHILIGAIGLEEVFPVPCRQGSLAPSKEGLVEAAGLELGNVALELVDPTFEGTQQCPGRAREPALEHADRKLHRGPVVERPVVVFAKIVGGPEVECVLAILSAGEIEAERAALPFPVERAAREVHHLLLGAADEVALPLLRCVAPQGLRRSEGVMVEQPPEVEPGRLPAHVGSGGEQQEMLCRPGESGEPDIAGDVRVRAAARRDAGQRLGKLVPARLGLAVLGPGGAQLVGLVEHHQVVRCDRGVTESRERALGREGIEGNDDTVTTRPDEWIRTTPDIRPGYDAALQPKQRAQLTFPIAHEPGRRNDQQPADTLAEQHLPDIEPGHDGLAGAGVVREQETQRLLRQHPLIDRNALVRKRVNPGGLARKGGVELVPVGQPIRFRHQQNGGGVPGEVQRHGGSRRPGIYYRARICVPGRHRLLNLA